MIFMEYRAPPLDAVGIGPHKSTKTFPSRLFAFTPSRILGTDDRVCLPTMQWSHLGGAHERSIGIPWTASERAISIIVRTLQWPSLRCQVSTSGTRWAYMARALVGFWAVMEYADEGMERV